MTTAIPIIIIVVAAIGAVVALSIAISTLRRALRQRSWLEATAEIVTSKVTSRLSPRAGDGPSAHLRRQFRPEIRFTYEVDGRRYESATHSLFVIESSDDREANAVVARYPAGARATAHYDPSDPSRAVLDRSIRWGALAVMGVVACVFGTVAVLGWRWS